MVPTSSTSSSSSRPAPSSSRSACTTTSSPTPDQEAIDELAEVFTASQYDIRRHADPVHVKAFRSADAYYARVKSPPSTSPILRLVEDFTYPRWGIREAALEPATRARISEPAERRGLAHGKEWIDTGILVERVNYAASQVGDITKPGIKKIINRLHEQGALARGVRGQLPRLDRPLDVSERPMRRWSASRRRAATSTSTTRASAARRRDAPAHRGDPRVPAV